MSPFQFAAGDHAGENENFERWADFDAGFLEAGKQSEAGEKVGSF